MRYQRLWVWGTRSDYVGRSRNEELNSWRWYSRMGRWRRSRFSVTLNAHIHDTCSTGRRGVFVASVFKQIKTKTLLEQQSITCRPWRWADNDRWADRSAAGLITGTARTWNEKISGKTTARLPTVHPRCEKICRLHYIIKPSSWRHRLSEITERPSRRHAHSVTLKRGRAPRLERVN